MGQAGDVVRQYFKALSDGDVAAAVGLVADGADFGTPMGAMTERGPIAEYLSAFERTFPKADYAIDTLVESGSAVAAEGRYRATHQGPMMLPDGSTLPATGREVTAPFVTMFEVSNGEIVSHRPYWDLAGLMAQLTED